MVIDLVAPSLDTTILATAQLLWSLGTTPGAWNRLRQCPELIPTAVVEAVRLASPVRGFLRTLTRDEDIDGVRLRAGERVALLFASANMDETQFPNPQRFDLNRRGGHVGWGYGVHACVGMHLSKLEMEALLRAMAPRVNGIEVWRPRRLINNGLQGLATFQAIFLPEGTDRFEIGQEAAMSTNPGVDNR
jgi:cytochrome P450